MVSPPTSLKHGVVHQCHRGKAAGLCTTEQPQLHTLEEELVSWDQEREVPHIATERPIVENTDIPRFELSGHGHNIPCVDFSSCGKRGHFH